MRASAHAFSHTSESVSPYCRTGWPIWLYVAQLRKTSRTSSQTSIGVLYSFLLSLFLTVPRSMGCVMYLK